MRRIELTFTGTSPDGAQALLAIDGERFGNASVDPRALLDSVHEAGGHFIMTCGGMCVPQCAGFDEPIFVSHTENAIIWEFESRYYPIPSKEDNPVSEIRTIEFDRQAYVEEVINKIRRWHELPIFEEMGNFKFQAEELELPTRAPVHELPPGSRIHIEYTMEFRQPYAILSPTPERRLDRILPNCRLFRLFGSWADLLEPRFLLDEAGQYVHSLPYGIKDGFTPDDCNKAANELAKETKEFWGDAAVISWQRIEASSPWRTTEQLAALEIQ